MFKAKLNSQISFAAVLLFVFVGVQQTASGFYSAMGTDAPELLSLLNKTCLFWLIGWWLTDDARRRGESLVYCVGLFLAIAWLLLLPYYLFKSRGRRAFITIAMFIAFVIATTIAGAVLGAVFGAMLSLRE